MMFFAPASSRSASVSEERTLRVMSTSFALLSDERFVQLLIAPGHQKGGLQVARPHRAGEVYDHVAEIHRYWARRARWPPLSCRHALLGRGRGSGSRRIRRCHGAAAGGRQLFLELRQHHVLHDEPRDDGREHDDQHHRQQRAEQRFAGRRPAPAQARPRRRPAAAGAYFRFSEVWPWEIGRRESKGKRVVRLALGV
jgi:hypothetical protein